MQFLCIGFVLIGLLFAVYVVFPVCIIYFQSYYYTFQMFRVAVLSCLLAAALAMPFDTALEGEWKAYKLAHNKAYTNEAEPLR